MGERVLIVEDGEKTAGILRAYLAAEGYDVETAADGLSALRAAERHRQQKRHGTVLGDVYSEHHWREQVLGEQRPL